MMKKLLILSITIMLICHAGMAQQDGWIKYCVSDEIAGSVGLMIPSDMTAAMRFTPEDLAASRIVSGATITKIALGVGVDLNYVNSVEIRIWEGGSSITDAGELVYTQSIPNFASFSENAMNEVTLTIPFVIDATKELRIGYGFYAVNWAFPIGRDKGPVVAGKGDIFKSSNVAGGSWISTYEAMDWDYNYSIKAFICKPCKSVNDLSSEKINDSSVLLSWTAPEGDLEIDGYHIFRNDTLLTTALITTTSYLDENLPVGEYEYYVITHYANGCISDSSNHIIETVALGVKNIENRTVIYPNPTTKELSVTSYQFSIESIEVFDVFGKNANIKFSSFGEARMANISHLPSGIYFIRITTERNVFTEKIIKY